MRTLLSHRNLLAHAAGPEILQVCSRLWPTKQSDFSVIRNPTSVIRLIPGLTLVISICMTSVAGAQDLELRFGTQVPAEVEQIYARGLQWLVENQTEEGNWSGHSGYHGPGDAGICGMALMVFLASGEDPNFGRYSENVRRTTRYMIGQQDASTGYLPGSMYHHGFAMLGLSEVYGVMDEDLLWEGSAAGNKRTVGEALELAVRCAVTAQKNNRFGGWRYTPDSNDADTSVSGAVLMGLLAARNAGIRVPDDTIEKALTYFQQMTSKQGGVGYSGGMGGLGGSKNLQAISALVMAIGRRRDLKEYEAVSQQVAKNIEHSEPSYPFYFRYYMAQALFQSDFESWERWNNKTIRQLENMQNADGSFQSQHGACYGTAMSLLALALNYRFLPIYER